MRHYEIILLVHPDQSEQVPEMIKRHEQMITDKKGKVHVTEDWGRRQLAYPINKLHKAHYLLTNIECDADTLQELETSFRFNDSIIRKLVLQRREPRAVASGIMQAQKDDDKKEPGRKKSQRLSLSQLHTVDYSHIDVLLGFVMENGRIVPSRITGTSARDQRRIAHAVKLARLLALLPYCDQHKA